MQLSIIIPLYNVESYVESCLNSCLAQDLPQDEYEFILIDDGSTDHSLSRALEALGDRAHVKTRSQENSGQGAARNIGLDLAEGRYVWFVDADDRIAENCIGSLVSRMERDSLDILSLRGADLLQDGGAAARRGYSCRGVQRGHSLIAEDQIQTGTPFSLYRRSFLTDRGLRFLERVAHEDALFTPKAYHFAERVGVCNDVVYYVYPNPTSTTRTVNPKRAEDYIAVVLKSLSDFAKEQGCERDFDWLISSGFSNALKNCYRLSLEDVAALDRCAYDNRALLAHLRHSRCFKYKVEGFAMSLLPAHMTAVYRFLEHFNPHKPSL